MGSTLPETRSNQLSLRQRRFAGNWKVLIIASAALAVGLAIALSASMAGVHRTAGSITAQPDRAKRNASRVVGPTSRNTGCLVTYTPTNWPGDFTANVTIGNRGTTSINGWTLTFTFPGDETISSAWNTAFTQTGTRVSATSTNYDATIPPGASQSFGFLGTWTSNDTAPTSFRVNGTACS
jgi:endo-1,4-beta-xylanase